VLAGVDISIQPHREAGDPQATVLFFAAASRVGRLGEIPFLVFRNIFVLRPGAIEGLELALAIGDHEPAALDMQLNRQRFLVAEVGESRCLLARAVLVLHGSDCRVDTDTVGRHEDELIAEIHVDLIAIDAEDASEHVGSREMQRPIERKQRAVVVGAQLRVACDAPHELARHGVDVDEQGAMDRLGKLVAGCTRLQNAGMVSLDRRIDDEGVGQVARNPALRQALRRLRDCRHATRQGSMTVPPHLREAIHRLDDVALPPGQRRDRRVGRNTAWLHDERPVEVIARHNVSFSGGNNSTTRRRIIRRRIGRQMALPQRLPRN
jgi:hypothetical protein